MRDWTRRRALQALAALPAAGVAGCTDRESFAEPPDPGPRRGRAVAYTARKVRDPDGNHLFWTGEDRPTPTEDPHREFRTVGADETTVTFASNSDPAAALRAFVEETDSTARRVVLATTPVEECHDLQLNWVGRDPSRLYATFCRSLRPAGVECTTDRYDRLAFGIRVPAPAEGERRDAEDTGTDVYRQCGVEPPRPVVPDTTTTEGDDV